MQLKILRANNGDAIHIRTKDAIGNFRNILIDGGTSKTYSFKNGKGKVEGGDLKQLIAKIREDNELIDLLILTHVDNDHIAGILKWFEDDEEAKSLVGKVWFNSGKLISELFEQKEIDENLLTINISSSNNTSISQGVTFEKIIEENGIWDRSIIKSEDKLDLFGMRFTILSPSCEKLQSLLCKWEREAPILDTSYINDYSFTLSELVSSDSFQEDPSIHNGSSIAFLLEKKGKSVLFLGDAHPQTIIDSLLSLGYSNENPLKVDFVKLSHHGSKGNTSMELLYLISTDKYIVSTNGCSHGHPNKTTISRIVCVNPKAMIYFNYPQLISKIILDKDKKDFPDVKFLCVDEL